MAELQSGGTGLPSGETPSFLNLRGGSSNAGFLIEPRSSLTPRDIESSLASPSMRRLRAQGSRAMIVIAPYLSRRARELLAQEEISYLDLTGNVRIVNEYPPVLIETEGATKDPSANQRPVRGLRGAAAGKIVRALVDARPPYGVTELGRAARVDPGYATRVLEALEAEALVERGRRGRVVDADWESLLRRRAEVVDLLDPRQTELYVAPADPAATVGRLKEWGELVISGSLAAARYARISVPTLLVVYGLRDRTELENALELRPVSQGANVALVRPQNTAPFFNAVSSPPLTFASPSQAAIDCLSGNGRMPAEGDAVIEWMRRDESAWRADSLDATSWPSWVDR